MNFKVLVADDEEMIRRGIISLLAKYPDFEVAAEAEDGEMALKMAVEIKPDLCLVDINMPFLNGLQLIEKLKEVNPKVVIVIITGYDRFEYAREALRLGTYEYLLKPVMEDAFEKMMNNVREKLIKDYNVTRYLTWAKQTLQKNRNYLISDFLRDVLQGHYENVEIRERSDYLDIRIPERYMVMVVYLEYQESEDLKAKWNDDLLFLVAENIANEIFNNLENIRSCQDNYGNLALIAEWRSSEETREKIEYFKSTLGQVVPIRCFTGTAFGQGYEKLPEVYEEALYQLKEVKGGSGIIQKLKECVNENYSREDFSLGEAAEYVGLSVQYVSKLFRREMGATFVDYLTSVRLRQAVKLLHDGDMKIYEIAERTGYATQHYFSNVFKKNMGMSPAEYRRNLKK